jgi:hypothetical protein
MGLVRLPGAPARGFSAVFALPFYLVQSIFVLTLVYFSGITPERIKKQGIHLALRIVAS